LSKDFPHTPWAEQAARTLERIENPPPGMVYVPEGRFHMGSNREELVKLLQSYSPRPEVLEDEKSLALLLNWGGYNSEMPQHVAPTDAFYIDKMEVTNEQYMEFVKEKGHTAPWPDGTFPEGEADRPVTNVTFEDAAAYAKYAGKRLPTEIEWEKAARGVDGRLYPWGNVWHPSRAQHMLDEDAGSTTVGLFPEGVSPYGCLDMIGNVMEWTNSWFEAYPGNDGEPGQVPYGSRHKALRGAAWYGYDLDGVPARCSTRVPATPDSKAPDRGFRCVRDVE
jgi:formylglycine-generating enzyme required for sulfatase activity